MTPLAVTPVLSCRRRRGPRRIAIKPLRHIEIEDLLAPDQSGQCLALHARIVFSQPAIVERPEESVGLDHAVGEDPICITERRSMALIRQTQKHGFSSAWGDLEDIVNRNFGSHSVWINRSLEPVYNSPVNSIFDVWSTIRNAPYPLGVAFVLREQKLRVA